MITPPQRRGYHNTQKQSRDIVKTAKNIPCVDFGKIMIYNVIIPETGGTQ